MSNSSNNLTQDLQLTNLNKESLEAIGQFAGKLGHDFNNVLASLQGCCELLQMKINKLHPNENICEKQFKIIDSSIKRGVEITTKIRAFTRPDPIEAAQIDLVPCVEAVVDILKKSGTVNVDIELVQQSSPKVTASGFLITQIIMNLCANALDAMVKLEERTLLIFITEEDLSKDTLPELKAGKYARVSVVDHGIGIKSEQKEKLFKPFYTTKKGGVGVGMGLGLAMAREIMQKLGGAIKVDSLQDAGTAAHLYIPLAN